MRDLTALDAHRLRTPDVLQFYGSFGDGTCGVFMVASPRTGQTLKVIASTGEGWDHVSVSLAKRCPNWYEMDHVKQMFFRDDETAMQLHVPTSDHISHHPNCLHLWRPNDGTAIPRPPAEFVA